MTLLAAAVAAGGPVIPSYGTTNTCVLDNGTFCFGWFAQHWSNLFQPALVQHIEMTVIAVAIGFVISFGLAVLAHRRRWLAPPVTFVTSVLYTIPALAEFELLVPITGLTWTSVEIPLVSYTLLLLFTNTLAGLSGISDDVRDAATGIGLTPRQILFRVEIPLALPTIVAGLRVATVTIISLAAVGAFIKPIGLGAVIFNALSNGDFKTQFIGAGALCVALALVADLLLVIAQRLLTPWAKARRPV